MGMAGWQTRADSKSGAERRESSSLSTHTCDCGAPAYILKTRECSRCYNRRYYHEVRRKSVYEYIGGKCAVCGSTDRLEVDHIDPEQKSFEISRNLTLDDRLKQELDKCQLLCADHHMAKTISDRPPFTHGTIYGFMKVKCHCSECEARKRVWYDERNERRRSQSENKKGAYRRPADHGEVLMYRRGCRCDECRKANTAHAKYLREKKRDQM